MASGNAVINQDLLDTYSKSFRFSKNDHSMALVLKINMKDLTVTIDENYNSPDTTLELVAEDLEESTPRFILYSYRWVRSDRYGDRKQFPISLIFYSPEGSNPSMNMVYTRAKVVIQNAFQGIQRAYDIRDKDGLSDEWLLSMLNKA